MSNLMEELSRRARTLGKEDRARLAEEMLASLDEADMDPEADVAWQKEIQFRVAQIKSGSVELIPAAEVFAETASIYK